MDAGTSDDDPSKHALHDRPKSTGNADVPPAEPRTSQGGVAGEADAAASTATERTAAAEQRVATNGQNSDFPPANAAKSTAAAEATASAVAVSQQPRQFAPSARACVPVSQVAQGQPAFVEKLRHSSAEPVVHHLRTFINDFPPNLTRPQAARSIHEFLRKMSPVLASTEAFGDYEDAETMAIEGLERFIINKLHKLLFRHAPADLREDERVELCIRHSTRGELTSADELDGTTLELAAMELKKVDQFKAPRDKLLCLTNARNLAQDALESLDKAGKRQGSAEAEQGRLRRFLAELIVHAAPPNLHSNIEFASHLRHPSRITPEEFQCIQDFSRALAAVTSGSLRRELAASSSEGGADGHSLTSSIGAGFQDAGDMRASGARLVGTGAQRNGRSHDSDLSGIWSGGAEALPLWLIDAGVTFHFESCSSNELLVGDVDELLEEYHRMIRTLRELVNIKERPAVSADPRP